MTENFEVKFEEKAYMPDPEYKKQSHMGDYKTAYQEFLKDPDNFWDKKARELDWMHPYEKVLEWDNPVARWFTGGKINITENCLDRHIRAGKRNKLAIIWRGEDGSEKVYTYRQLLRDVMRFANALKKIGVKRGDRICFYMPFVPEHIIALLACARIGAVHSVVYAGFGAEALRIRIKDAEAKVVITADVGKRRGKLIPLRSIVDDAVRNTPCVEKVIVLCREHCPVELYSELEVDFYSILKNVEDYCPAEEMDSEDPLFILYTSGTTGQPKGIVHACGGYSVGVHYTTKNIFDIKDNDVFWCTADPGWITGHSYILYGPLSVGATVVITETTPDWPDPGVWWKIIEEFGVTIFYTAPTAIRMFMRVGEEWPDKYNLDSLRLIGSVGEPLNPEAFEWYYRVIGKSRCPVLDTWWQTETGMHMITTPIGEPMKPGFAGVPIPGVVVDVVDEDGSSTPTGQGGHLVIKKPWPSMLKTVYHNEERYRHYWNHIKPYYATGDLAVRDKDGYIMILGRSDDIIIVSGHNLGTAEVESALVEHEAVAEAAVIGIPDEIKGQSVKAYVILIKGYEPGPKLVSELTYHVRMSIGPIAMPSSIEFVDSLPKTRSGKIMRRLLKSREMNTDPGDTSALEE